LYGITGCITRDTVTIEVKPGFEEDYIPTLIRASIEQDSARVFWQGHPSASEYHVYRNGSLIAETTNTFYFEAYNHPAAIYQMSPLNVCQNHAPMSNPGQLIWLQASKEGNERADLNWNAYQEWDSGVGSYELEVYTKYLGDVSSTG
jgi:hypothetical protein